MKNSGRGFNHLPAVIAAMPRMAHEIVEKATTDVAANAAATAPIDTGALAASYHAEIEGDRGRAGSNMEYAPYVEYGTIHTGAQPHLVPAAERVADALNRAAPKAATDKIEKAAKDGRT